MMYLNKAHFKSSRISKTPSVLFTVIKLKTSGVSKLKFFYLRKLEISEISEFSIWYLCKNWKLGKLENCFKTCNCFRWTKLGIFKVSKFSILALIQKPKTRKTGKLSQDLQSSLIFVVCLRKLEISKVTEFSVFALILTTKTWKLGQFFKASNLSKLHFSI